MSQHHAQEWTGAIVGTLAHFANSSFDLVPKSADLSIKQFLIFFNVGFVNTEDIHSIIMAAICAAVGFIVTKLFQATIDFFKR